MTPDEQRDDFLSAVRALTDKSIWKLGGASVVASSFTLHLGDAITAEQMGIVDWKDRPEGEAVLWVECAWRLRRGSDVLCSWRDDFGDAPPATPGLRSLIGRRVVRAESIPPIWDLNVEFEDDLSLEIFNDVPLWADYQDCYSVFSLHQTFTVIAGGALVVSRRWSRPRNGL